MTEKLLPSVYAVCPQDIVGVCHVCTIVNPVRRAYGADACDECIQFFEWAVATNHDPICRNVPSVGVNIKNCHYCWLNRCLFFMRVGDVYAMNNKLAVCSGWRKRNPKFFSEKFNWPTLFSKVLSYLCSYKKSFSEWIKLFPEYNKLEDIEKAMLLSTCLLRGILVEIVEYSYGIHGALKFPNFFFDPFKYSKTNETVFIGDILLFTWLMEEICQSEKQLFNAFKMKLVLKDFVSMEFDSHHERILDELAQRLSRIEAKFRSFLDSSPEAKRQLDVNPDNVSRLPGVYPLPPDHTFPLHFINVIIP